MSVKHIFLVGAKSIGSYGGYETFINKLSEYHANDKDLKYHIYCKANGEGCLDFSSLSSVTDVKYDEDGSVCSFSYNNAEVFLIKCPKLGSAVAIYYDIASLRHCIKYIKENDNIEKGNFVVYIMACRIGPFFKSLADNIRRLGGLVFLNPDGHEWLRAKWNKAIRAYWKLSEKLMVKHSDLIICDSINIEKYIKESYKRFKPKTTYIAYGAETRKSKCDEAKYKEWLSSKNLKENEYFLIVGRFVPENNYETMIKEYLKSKTTKDFAIITTNDEKFLKELDDKLSFSSDKRIKFVGTVYDSELLLRIREGAFAYLHGHEVGGTNPSLLEALGSTKLNLLLKVGFNEEVGCDSALYWTKEDSNLSSLIDEVSSYSEEKIDNFGILAKKRIKDAYSWEYIASRYKEEFLKG